MRSGAASRIATLFLLLCAFAVTAVELPKQPVIASAHLAATEAGMQVLAEGGNAFDAAIAVSATLGLVEPESSGIGGGAFFLLHLAIDDRDVFVDAREMAPAAASRDMFLDGKGAVRERASIDGALAAAIPGLPAGFEHLARRYGRLPLTKSLAPAIALARKGWRFGAKNAAMLGWRTKVVEQDAGARRLFLRDGKPPAIGTSMRNPDYARTLELLAREGSAGFYRGRFAADLVRGVRAAGGIWTEQDLAEYRVVERDVLRLQHRGFELVTLPPPSSGGIAIAEVLNTLQGFDYSALGRLPRLHLVLESMRRAYRDRALYLGDPDFVKVPLELLVSDAYAAGLRASINPDRALPSAYLPDIAAPAERNETTHFSIIDVEGNYAAVTQTVNLPYGNAVVVPGTGFLLNNEMDDFSVKPGVPNAFGLVGERANEIAPRKRPLSSMTPTFLRSDAQVAVIGTPGGSRIISMVLLGLLELMDGRDAQAAADLPRIHHQYLPDQVSHEPGALNVEEINALRARGFIVGEAESTWGNMQVATWNRQTGAVAAGNDRRWGQVSTGHGSNDATR